MISCWTVALVDIILGPKGERGLGNGSSFGEASDTSVLWEPYTKDHKHY